MDFEFVTVLPPVVGTYRSTLIDIPVYGRRETYLPMAKRWFAQVRVRGMGGLYWINERATS